MKMDGIELRFTKEFTIGPKGTIDGRLNAKNEVHMACVKAVRNAFLKIYEVEERACPGRSSRRYFWDHYLDRNPLFNHQLIGKILSMVVPYTSSDTHGRWTWHHPMDIILGCNKLLEEVDQWNSNT